MAAEDFGHFVCIPTMRLREAAEGLRQLDANMDHYGRRVPVIIFSDAYPDARDAEGNLRFPNYEEDFAHLQNVARSCTNDVYIVGREEKEAFKEMLREKAGPALAWHKNQAQSDLLHEKGDILDQMLEGSAGGNKNYVLLYTLGARILQLDDDIRPYEIISTRTFNDTYGGTEYDGSKGTPLRRLWQTTEIRTPDNRSVYEILNDFDPDPRRRVRVGEGKLYGKDILDRMGESPLGSEETRSGERISFTT